MIKNNAHVPGLFTVMASRTTHPKHNHIPDDEWPSAADIQSSRLNNLVNEAETFDMALKIKGAQTLRRSSAQLQKCYENTWTDEENKIADLIAAAYKEKQMTLSEVINFAENKTTDKLDVSFVLKVKEKLDVTNEVLLKEDPPYVNEADYIWLKQNQAPGRKRM